MFENWKRNLMIGAAALTVAGGIATAGMGLAPQQLNAAPATIGLMGSEGHRGFGHKGGGAHGEHLAAALGIDVATLDSAKEAVRETLREQAQGNGETGRSGHKFDREEVTALLAAQLQISVETLEAAMETARQAALDEALANGDITEEDVAVMEARAALREYIDPKAMMAEALGLTPEQLENALDNGTRLRELLEQQGLDRETFVANLQAAHANAIQQAVAEGIISAEQAELLNEAGDHFGPGGRRGGFRSGGGRDFSAPQEGTSAPEGAPAVGQL